MENLTCCELSKKSELVRSVSKNFPYDDTRIIVMREVQDEFGQLQEQIFFCPFCGKKITKETVDEYDAKNLDNAYKERLTS